MSKIAIIPIYKCYPKDIENKINEILQENTDYSFKQLVYFDNVLHGIFEVTDNEIVTTCRI